MPTHLSSKSRPKAFADVFGQQSVTRVLINDIVNANPHHLILTGPSGTGKSTLAGLYAPAWLCHHPTTTGSPCRNCEACSAWEKGGNADFRKIHCPSHGNKDDIEYVLTTFLEYRPLTSRYRVALFDEAQALSLPAQQMLLETLEAEPSGAVCIFTLISADSLIEPLQSRGRKFQLETPDMQKSLSYLVHLATRERIEAEPEALKLIAAFSTGYRNLAENLDTAAGHSLGGPITLATVRALFRDRSQMLLDFLGHCANGRVGEQLQSLDSINVAAREKLAGIIEVLKHLLVRYVGPSRIRRADHRLTLLLSDQDCRRVLNQFAARASELGRTIHGLFDEILEFWLDVPSDVDNNRLEAHALRFHQLLMFNSGGAASGGHERGSPVRTARNAQKPFKWRTRDHAGVIHRRGDWLTLSQAREIYEAGTFLAQAHGRWFNAKITVDHSLLSAATDEVAAERISDWLRRLRQSFFAPAARHHGPSAELHRIPSMSVGAKAACGPRCCLTCPGMLRPMSGRGLPNGRRRRATRRPSTFRSY